MSHLHHNDDGPVSFCGVNATDTDTHTPVSSSHPHWTLVWVSLSSLAVGLVLLLYVSKRRRRRRRRQQPEASEEAWSRKQDFIQRAGDNYGYRDTPRGHIDTWRLEELPQLIPPLHQEPPKNLQREEPEVYLDYAGSALPTKTQLEAMLRDDALLANPHSSGPAASRTALLISQVKQRILEHLNATSGKFSGHPPSQHSHPGYDLIFTSGATESLRIVAERFPFQKCCHCQRASQLLYAQNSHTSVVGMRGPAQAQGATFQCLPMKDISTADKAQFQTWAGKRNECRHCQESSSRPRNLLVIPAECNFGGDRPPVQVILETSQMAGWCTMLDLAKAASTGPIHLRDWNPDFACLSFYKLFGAPTGLGVLLVKRSSIDLLAPQSESSYFGGGSVDVVLPAQNVVVPRSELASLSNGTVHFRGIVSLAHGLDELDRMGGMSKIHQHGTSLALELARRLLLLRHGNGRPAVVLYGAWAKHVSNNSKTPLPGPTVAFNVLQHDGTLVGYNQVSKLAALHQPPLQFRTGCFCNPGACQEALELKDDQIINNYKLTGHVCGDHIDLVHGQPTGAIRVSFGKDSIWEDLDAVCTFLETTFVNQDACNEKQDSAEEMNGPTSVTVSELYIFPIKSCAAQRVKRWKMEFPSGRLAFDREFALVDTSGTAMRLQSCPKMGLLRPTIDVQKRTLTVSAPGCLDIVLQLDDETQECEDSVVKVCGNKCGGRVWGNVAASEWFSSFLGVQCWLARYSNGEYHSSSGAHSSTARNPQVAFANEQPLLLVAENAVDILNDVLSGQKQKRVHARQFRPNVVVKASMDTWFHFEDRWTALALEDKNLKLQVMGDCARCAMVDFDPTTCAKGKTLRALAKYRRRNGQITFGIFLQGIHVGNDQSEVWLEKGDLLQCN
jgi:molybdenum cofactor sulfurtransferase